MGQANCACRTESGGCLPDPCVVPLNPEVSSLGLFLDPAVRGDSPNADLALALQRPGTIWPPRRVPPADDPQLKPDLACVSGRPYGVPLFRYNLTYRDFADLRRIGEGSYGVVLGGRYNGADYALKLSANPTAKQSASGGPPYDTLSDDMIRELAHLRSLGHPCILPVCGAGFEKPHGDIDPARMPDSQPGLTVMVSPLGNESLQSLLGRAAGGKLALAHGALRDYVPRFAFRLLCALDFIHNRGVLHCDIKPGNVILRGDDVFLSDFGFAVGGYVAPAGPLVAYTDGFRAPELLFFPEGRALSPKADVWALGVTILLACFPELVNDNPLAAYPEFEETGPGRALALEQRIGRLVAFLGPPGAADFAASGPFPALGAGERRRLGSLASAPSRTGSGTKSPASRATLAGLLGEAEASGDPVFASMVALAARALAYDPARRPSARGLLRDEVLAEFVAQEGWMIDGGGLGVTIEAGDGVTIEDAAVYRRLQRPLWQPARELNPEALDLAFGRAWVAILSASRSITPEADRASPAALFRAADILAEVCRRAELGRLDPGSAPFGGGDTGVGYDEIFAALGCCCLSVAIALEDSRELPPHVFAPLLNFGQHPERLAALLAQSSELLAGREMELPGTSGTTWNGLRLEALRRGVLAASDFDITAPTPYTFWRVYCEAGRAPTSRPGRGSDRAGSAQAGWEQEALFLLFVAAASRSLWNRVGAEEAALSIAAVVLRGKAGSLTAPLPGVEPEKAALVEGELARLGRELLAHPAHWPIYREAYAGQGPRPGAGEIVALKGVEAVLRSALS